MNLCQAKYRHTTDAGGVIVRKNGDDVEVLLFQDHEYDDWKLPKGHAEEGETLEQTAKREVREETGVTKVKIHELLGTFRRIVESRKEDKTIHYFLMTTNPDQHTEKPEDGTLRVAWFPIDQLPSIYLEEQSRVILENSKKITKLFSKV